MRNYGTWSDKELLALLINQCIAMLNHKMEKVGQLLEEAAQQWGDREAVVSCQQGIRKTYSQVGQTS